MPFVKFLKCFPILFILLCPTPSLSMNDMDEETQKKLLLCAKASEKSYDKKEMRNDDKFLLNNKFHEIGYLPEKEGVQTVAWVNEEDAQLIIANRGTVISKPQNLLADLGIIEAMVRVKNGDLSSRPWVKDIAEFTKELTENNIKLFNGNNSFKISSVSENIILNEILNFNRLHLRGQTAYATGGGIAGLAATGIGAFLFPPSLFITVPTLLLGAGTGIGVGIAELEREVQTYVLKPARTSLASTLTTMYDNTNAFLSFFKEKGKYSEETEILLTGHSLGGEGTIAVASRLNGVNNLNCFVFNAPGGHEGVIKIWQQEKQIQDWGNINPNTSILHVHRNSCLIAKAGSFPTHTKELDLGPHYRGTDKSIENWCNTRMDEHSINYLRIAFGI